MQQGLLFGGGHAAHVCLGVCRPWFLATFSRNTTRSQPKSAIILMLRGGQGDDTNPPLLGISTITAESRLALQQQQQRLNNSSIYYSCKYIRVCSVHQDVQQCIQHPMIMFTFSRTGPGVLGGLVGGPVCPLISISWVQVSPSAYEYSYGLFLAQ